MLAAVSGLAYALATTMHLEGYLGYFLPLPVILSALRSGPAAGRKTMTATAFLLLGEPSTEWLGCVHLMCGDAEVDSPGMLWILSLASACVVHILLPLHVRTAAPAASLVPDLRSPAIQLLTLLAPKLDLVCPQCCWGPIKALSYLFTHGVMAATLGFTWSRRMGWLAGVALGSTVRAAV